MSFILEELEKLEAKTIRMEKMLEFGRLQKQKKDLGKIKKQFAKRERNSPSPFRRG